MMFVVCNTKLLKTCFLFGCIAAVVFVASFAFERKSIAYYTGVTSDATTNSEELFTSVSTRTGNQTVYVMKELTTHILSNQLIVLLPKRMCKEHTSLVIIICSAPGNFERRQTIRKTWGSDRNVSNFFTDVYFMVGRTFNKALQKQIEDEYKAYDDIIQEEILDTYKNLTAKSLMMLQVINTYCSNETTYFMKTDDDMYVNLLPLKNVLSKSSKTNLLLGHKYNHPIPKRDPKNKWYVPLSVYSEKYYPDFLSGSGYVISTDVVRKLYQAALKIPLYFLEDVYITGMLAQCAGVTPQNHPGFHPNKQDPNPCLYKSIITAHNYTCDEMVELYEGIKKMTC